MSIWVKICKYVDIGNKYKEYRFFVIMFEDIDLSEKCRKISNLSKNLDFEKIVKILDFGQNLPKYRFCSKDRFW